MRKDPRFPKLHIVDHPLVQHKLTLMREKETSTRDFRELLKEIAMLMGYELTRDYPLTTRRIETPLAEFDAPVMEGKKPVIVPVLRAGLGMTDGLLTLMPGARVGHIGLYRDEITHKPHEYYCKLPFNISEREIYVLDPMLATGGSAIDAVSLLKNKGAKNIHFLCIIAAPEGVKAFSEAHPDVKLFIGCLDRCLNSKAYICPGLGDAGDRIYGTK